MLGLADTKGTLSSDADADLVILSESSGAKGRTITVDQVWKFGVKVFDRESV
jgi:N-acetylglucosamine-6-phosphate deacetylase